MEENESVSKSLNRLAREQVKLRILNDIKIDMAVCEIEGWDKTEYINELKELINSIGKEIKQAGMHCMPPERK